MLDAALLEWIRDNIAPTHQKPVRSLLGRFNTEQQLDEALAFVRFRVAQNIGGQPICAFLVMATRLASVIGERSLLAATVEDMSTVQNRKAWYQVRSNSRSLEPVQVRVPSDRSRLRQQREMISFYTYHWTRPGTSADEARRRGIALVRPPGLVILGRPRELPYCAITPAQAELALQKIPEMRLSILERVVYTAFIGWIIDNGSRTPSMLRCRLGDVERDPDGVLSGIQPPPGPRNKLTARLAAGPHAATLEPLLAHHPDAENPEAPLFFDPIEASAGVVASLWKNNLDNFLKRLGEKMGLPFKLGIRPFRRLHHNEMAVNGDDDALMRTAHGHRFGSNSPSSYTRLDKDAALRAMWKIRDAKPRVPACSACLTALTPQDTQCPWCKKSTLPQLDAVAWGQDDYVRAELAGRLGLAALKDVGDNASEGR
jgi:hypothetical protein